MDGEEVWTGDVDACEDERGANVSLISVDGMDSTSPTTMRERGKQTDR